jgi:two-component system nitrate/nitrite response regulator NarL
VNAEEAAAVRGVLLAALGQRPPADAAADAEFLAERTNRLSGRQQEVLELVAEGRTEAQIARALGFALTTAKTHKTAMFRTLGARSAAHAVAIGFRQGLLR